MYLNGTNDILGVVAPLLVTGQLPMLTCFAPLFAMFSPMLAQSCQDKVDIVLQGYRDKALMCR